MTPSPQGGSGPLTHLTPAWPPVGGGGVESGWIGAAEPTPPPGEARHGLVSKRPKVFGRFWMGFELVDPPAGCGVVGGQVFERKKNGWVWAPEIVAPSGVTE